MILFLAAGSGVRQQEKVMTKIKESRMVRLGRAKTLTRGDLIGAFLEFEVVRYRPI